ncbi:NAD(P)H-binding protein [Streptomyces thermoviolaceus]|uniref:NAD(P)H-binding protein n=1 Tax=Streptomyces thermoviolaceus TaxID=1952 RepID=UPI003869C91B|nr:NAD(P)H-binding protein [Streptomyces thermoviolaceus]
MIVVTGATGNVGRALVQCLVAAGRPVRALTRHPERAGLPDGAEAVRFRPDDLGAAFTGASRLFLYVQAAGGRPDALLEAARAAGVRHVVLLSSAVVDEGADTTHPVYVMHATVEERIRAGGLAWTFLRPGAFATNSLQWAPQIRSGNTVRGVYADARSAPVHEDDIAAVAERALLDDGHEGAVHRITGPEAVTNAGQVAAIGRALGRELVFEEVPPEQAGPALFPHVQPHALQGLLRTFRASVGSTPEITDTVERITGTPARTFAQWARDHKADFQA